MRCSNEVKCKTKKIKNVARPGRNKCNSDDMVSLSLLRSGLRSTVQPKLDSHFNVYRKSSWRSRPKSKHKTRVAIIVSLTAGPQMQKIYFEVLSLILPFCLMSSWQSRVKPKLGAGAIQSCIYFFQAWPRRLDAHTLLSQSLMQEE